MEAIPCEEICRLCISDRKTIEIFSVPDLKTPKYCEIASILSTKIKISRDDTLPKGICNECALKLISFFNFKIQIEKSQDELLNLCNDEIPPLELKDYPEYSDVFEIQETDDLENVNLPQDDYSMIEESKEEIISNFEELNYSDYGEDDSNDADYTPDEHSKSIRMRTLTKQKFKKSIQLQDIEELSPEKQSEWQKKLSNWIKKQAKENNSKRKETRHICEVCGKDYSTKWALKDHEYVHTGILKFECVHCGRKFGQKKLLNSHMEVKHIKSKFFKCQICNKVFNRKNTLTKHRWAHIEHKRFSCVWPGCGKMFRWKTCLDEHVNTHTNSKQYLCYICDKHYTSRSARNKHCSQLHNGDGMKEIEIKSEEVKIVS